VLILNTAITDGWTAPKRFIAGTVGVAGGFLVGGITFLMGAPWWWLPLWDRIAMSALLVVTATAVYIGMRNLHILSAFYLFLLPIVLAQLMFGARCGIAAAFVSLVSIYYFAIPPKNSFALQSLREICLLAAFALLAFITSATLAVQTDIAGIKDDHQPLQ
jgi:K+-sensing histidine kinase KdpD